MIYLSVAFLFVYYLGQRKPGSNVKLSLIMPEV